MGPCPYAEVLAPSLITGCFTRQDICTQTQESLQEANAESLTY